MGADFDFAIVRGGNKLHVERTFERLREERAHEHGHGGYTGTFAETPGIEVKPNLIFKTRAEAQEFLYGMCKKWENAIAVQFRNDKGQLNWLIGACCSS